MPFHSHEIDAYWNDIGSISEYLQGNADALAGEIEIERPPEVADGSLRRQGLGPRRRQGEAAGDDRARLRDRRGRRPAWAGGGGEGCRIGAGGDDPRRGGAARAPSWRRGRCWSAACAAPSGTCRWAEPLGAYRRTPAQPVTRRLPLVRGWSCCERSRVWRRRRVAAPAGAIAGSESRSATAASASSPAPGRWSRRDRPASSWRSRPPSTAALRGTSRSASSSAGDSAWRPPPRPRSPPPARPSICAGRSSPCRPPPWRWRWRGFDPAEEIALALAGLTGLPVLALPPPRGRAQAGRAPAGGAPGGPPRVRTGGPGAGRVHAGGRRLDHRRHAGRLRGGPSVRRLQPRRRADAGSLALAGRDSHIFACRPAGVGVAFGDHPSTRREGGRW